MLWGRKKGCRSREAQERRELPPGAPRQPLLLASPSLPLHELPQGGFSSPAGLLLPCAAAPETTSCVFTYETGTHDALLTELRQKVPGIATESLTAFGKPQEWRASGPQTLASNSGQCKPAHSWH